MALPSPTVVAEQPADLGVVVDDQHMVARLHDRLSSPWT
jgi:hypothetical protein